MKKGCIVVDEFYHNNRLFDVNDPISNRDNCLCAFNVLREELLKHGVDLATQDIHAEDRSEIVIYNDLPKRLPVKNEGRKLYLLALESLAIKPGNGDKDKLKAFDRIFTWNDGIVDGDRIIKINYPNLLRPVDTEGTKSKTKLICLVAANKVSSHRNELYSGRRKAIEWFEKHHPGELDLYGMGWDGLPLNSWRARLLKRIGMDKLIKGPGYQCYKGSVPEKAPILRQYKYSICYENIKGVPGYITEKIFDSFLAGCVPVYRGADNVTDYIPGNCFIDRRNFATYEALYDFIKSIDENRYQEYLVNINRYFESEQSRQFSAEHFAKTIVSRIIE